MNSVWQNLEVEIASLPQIEEVHFQRHPLRYKRYHLVVAVLLWSAPVVAFVVFASLFPGWWAVLVGAVLMILILLTLVGIRIGYRKRSYALRQKDIIYKRGWIFHTLLTIPFNRIQHTEVSEGPVERKFSLCTLSIYTAGGSTSDLRIPGLEKDEAQQLRDYISKKAAAYV